MCPKYFISLLFLKVAWSLPEGIREYFTQGFNYANASGYLCQCVPGYEGMEALPC